MNWNRIIKEYPEEQSDTQNDTIQDLRNDLDRLEKENELIKASLKQLCSLIGIEFESHPYYEPKTSFNGNTDSGFHQPLYELVMKH